MNHLELKKGYTVGVLACGTMGTAVLNAMVTALTNTTEDEAEVRPGRFIAAVNSQTSAKKLEEKFGSKMEILCQENNELVRNSDLIILGCKPFMAEKILDPIPNSLFVNKTVVSLLAGKTINQLSELTGGNAIIARALTNTSATIGCGMTIVSLPETQIPDSIRDAISWIFNNTGRCIFLEEKHQDTATALCGSGPAFCYLFMEALCDGAVRMGMPYAVAKECAAQVMKGAGELVLQSEQHPAVLRTTVCTPGGTTIGGLLIMEDNKVRGSVARAVEEATNIATRLGGAAKK